MPEIPRVFLSTSNIGDGNLWTAYALEKAFDTVYPSSVRRSTLTASSLPAKIFHRYMTQNSEARERYTYGGDHLRQGMAAYFFGLFQLLETAWKNHKLVVAAVTHVPEYAIGGFVQEHQLQHWSHQALGQFLHTFLAIPDVYPKRSAVHLARQKNVPLYVWTRKAKQELQRAGVSSALIAPFLLNPFLPKGCSLGELEQGRVLVKTSGSGIPPNELTTLVRMLKLMHMEYEIHLPTAILTHYGVLPAPLSFEERIGQYITSFIDHPPQVLITQPSEQTQFSVEARLAGWQGTHLVFSPRGTHERRNSKWGKERGVIQDQIEGIHHLPRYIRVTKHAKKATPRELRTAVGTISVLKACEAVLNQVQ